jgi:hypothetical protein
LVFAAPSSIGSFPLRDMFRLTNVVGSIEGSSLRFGFFIAKAKP